jgi:hypothetical protein
VRGVKGSHVMQQMNVEYVAAKLCKWAPLAAHFCIGVNQVTSSGLD